MIIRVVNACCVSFLDALCRFAVLECRSCVYATGPIPGQPQRACCDFWYVSQSINIQTIKYTTRVEWAMLLCSLGFTGGV